MICMMPATGDLSHAAVDGDGLAEFDRADEQKEHDRRNHREFDRSDAVDVAAHTLHQSMDRFAPAGAIPIGQVTWVPAFAGMTWWGGSV
jgi:hypothetical protein